MEDLNRTQGRNPKKVKQQEDYMEVIMLAAVIFCAMYAIFSA